MSAAVEQLRGAAAKMRKRADEATLHPAYDLPWMVDEGADGRATMVLAPKDVGGWDGIVVGTCHAVPDAAHIASWDPTAARAVADLLDAGADEIERRVARDGEEILERANPVFHAMRGLARTYLGEDA